MNIEKIKEIISQNYPDQITEHLIIKTISEDENVVPNILAILDAERKRKTQLLSRMNLELSRAHLGLEKPEINREHFMDKSIHRFYILNKDQIGHVFKNLKNVELTEEEKAEENKSIFGGFGAFD